ncbi:trypsin-like cysteine/serine peptidase domain-containing protein [Chytriomyces cf. hyalinus JEL632]|nr:trypsin-like cysteine/serine peptidase domain-containing protein [Chytriomyces cf. hyalinus JEL632]
MPRNINALLSFYLKYSAGDWVVSIGNPFGLQNTATVGIVSSQCRKSVEIGRTDSRVEYFQTDCIIHSGSSGGPFVNIHGEVIGINAMRADSEGISFAIKVDHSLDMINQLLHLGKIVRAPVDRRWNGVSESTRLAATSPANTHRAAPTNRHGRVDIAKDSPAPQSHLASQAQYPKESLTAGQDTAQ